MHDRGISTNRDDDFWDNLANMYSRLNSHEIKGARLRVTYHEVMWEFNSDEDGYFGVDIPMPDSIKEPYGWHYPQIELISSPVEFNKPVSTIARVLVPPLTAKFGVISDIDDEIHAHTGGAGYEMQVQAGRPAKGSFTIDSPGSFEVESHHLEKIIAILTTR